jgi:hypothetical protein
MGESLSDIFPENFCTEQGRKLLFLPRSGLFELEWFETSLNGHLLMLSPISRDN